MTVLKEEQPNLSNYLGNQNSIFGYLYNLILRISKDRAELERDLEAVEIQEELVDHMQNQQPQHYEEKLRNYE